MTHPITQSIIELMTAVAEPTNEVLLTRLIQAPYWQISLPDIAKMLRARSYDQPLLTLISSDDALTEIEIESREQIQRFTDTLATARNNSAGQAPHEVLQTLLQESGFLDHVLADYPTEGVRVVRRLYDEIEAMVVRDTISSLADVVSALEQYREHNLPLTAPFLHTAADAVSVMTTHKAKGLEFTTVFMPHVVDNAWGGSKKPQHFKIPFTRAITEDQLDQLDDERRLLYVGITRAKQSLYFSHSHTNSEGRELLPSRLLEELDPATYEVVDTAGLSEAHDASAALRTVSGESTLPLELLQSLFQERGFSATSINNYLQSPWNYFFRNLLRLPEVQAMPLQYGTVVHNVLQNVTEVHNKTGDLPTVSDMKQWLETELGRLPITTKTYTDLHAKGLAALTVYREQLGSLPSKTQAELSLKVMLPTGVPECPELPLSGKLDRIDFDESGKAVRVVDYKTGKPRSRNGIEGKTKTSDGGYKRQLVFYALLLELYDDERYQTREAVLSFVEPTPKGDIKEESFTITDEEVMELKAEIIAAAKHIMSGAFLADPCDESVSEYCHLAQWWYQPEM